MMQLGLIHSSWESDFHFDLRNMTRAVCAYFLAGVRCIIFAGLAAGEDQKMEFVGFFN